jgi:hypothetical protein
VRSDCKIFYRWGGGHATSSRLSLEDQHHQGEHGRVAPARTVMVDRVRGRVHTANACQNPINQGEESVRARAVTLRLR